MKLHPADRRLGYGDGDAIYLTAFRQYADRIGWTRAQAESFIAEGGKVLRKGGIEAAFASPEEFTAKIVQLAEASEIDPRQARDLVGTVLTNSSEGTTPEHYAPPSLEQDLIRSEEIDRLMAVQDEAYTKDPWLSREREEIQARLDNHKQEMLTEPETEMTPEVQRTYRNMKDYYDHTLKTNPAEYYAQGMGKWWERILNEEEKVAPRPIHSPNGNTSQRIAEIEQTMKSNPQAYWGDKSMQAELLNLTRAQMETFEVGPPSGETDDGEEAV